MGHIRYLVLLHGTKYIHSRSRCNPTVNNVQVGYENALWIFENVQWLLLFYVKLSNVRDCSCQLAARIQDCLPSFVSLQIKIPDSTAAGPTRAVPPTMAMASTTNWLKDLANHKEVNKTAPDPIGISHFMIRIIICSRVPVSRETGETEGRNSMNLSNER